MPIRKAVHSRLKKLENYIKSHEVKVTRSKVRARFEQMSDAELSAFMKETKKEWERSPEGQALNKKIDGMSCTELCKYIYEQTMRCSTLLW